MPVTCWDGWRWHRASGAAHTGRGQRSDPVSSTAALGHDLLPLPAAPARYPQRQVWVRYQEEIFPQEGGEELEVPLPCGGDPRPGCMGLGAGTRWVLSSLPTSPIPQRCDGDKRGWNSQHFHPKPSMESWAGLEEGSELLSLPGSHQSLVPGGQQAGEAQDGLPGGSSILCHGQVRSSRAFCHPSSSSHTRCPSSRRGCSAAPGIAQLPPTRPLNIQ